MEGLNGKYHHLHPDRAQRRFAVLPGAVSGVLCALSRRRILDTIADIVFTAVCLIRLLPVLEVPAWLYTWIAVIAVIKLLNIAIGYAKQKKLAAVHSVMNKAAGGLLFLFPLTLTWIDLRYSAAVVCAVAAVAAVYEGYLIQTGKTA